MQAMNNKWDDKFGLIEPNRHEFSDLENRFVSTKRVIDGVVEDAAKDSIEIKNPKNLNNIIAKTFKQEYFRRVA